MVKKKFAFQITIKDEDDDEFSLEVKNLNGEVFDESDDEPTPAMFMFDVLMEVLKEHGEITQSSPDGVGHH